MKLKKMLAATLIALFMIINGFSTSVAKADETPIFDAHIEDSFQGCLVKGTLTEVSPDTRLIQPLYSLDGETWQTCGESWNLYWLEDENAAPEELQNQICLYNSQEPLNSYLAGSLDRFYLKLSITLEDGTTYETQAAVIDRGCPQPLPEGITPRARFSSDLYVFTRSPLSSHGQYQLTVSADAAPEDISALLPDTLPVEIQLYSGLNCVTKGIIDCPVTWKPLSLPALTEGESVTVYNAAEPIVIPGETLLNTPTGIYRLNEPMTLNAEIDTDEVRLVLNVVAKNAVPTGVLSSERDGLTMAFDLKPTGATAIWAYTFSESAPEWTKLPAPLPLETINTPTSVANSCYVPVLDNTAEPYRSYLAAKDEENQPEPFYVGLQIEGGVYDGRQLILAWPDTYELPLDLPKIGGAEGNECNAGSDNKNDSTEDGQRPGLPQEPQDGSIWQETALPQEPQDEPIWQTVASPQELQDEPLRQEIAPPQKSESKQDIQDASETTTILPGSRSAQEQEYEPPVQFAFTEPVVSTEGSKTAETDIPSVIAQPASLTTKEDDSSPATNTGRLFFPAAAAAAAATYIAIIASKTTTDGISGVFSGKILSMLHRLLHLK